ncbi:MAG: NAD-glutamate dehydrogenase domain-containing protein [Deferribacterales bacterium]
MNSFSAISCLTRNDLAKYKGTQFDQRHKKVFAEYKGTPFYEFAKVLMSHLPQNFVGFLSDEDMTGLYKHLFSKLEGRKKKKIAVSADLTEELPFFIGNFCIFSIVTDDRPFIFDSLWEYLQNIREHKIFVIHPIFGIERGRNGEILKISESRLGVSNESFVVIFLEGLNRNEVSDIKKEITSIYENVAAAVDDFPKMKEAMSALFMEYRERSGDVAKFIQWLMDENFICQGTRIVEIDESKDFKSFSDTGVFTLMGQDPNYALLARSVKDGRLNTVDGYPVIVDKAVGISKVKRRTNFDRVMFVDRQGTKIRLFYLAGLFSSKAHKCPPYEISILRDKIKATLDYFDFVTGSHDYKWIRDILDEYPKIEIFNLSSRALTELLELILTMQGANQIRISYHDFRPLKNLIFFMAMPLSRYSSELVMSIKNFLEEYFGGRMMDISIREDQHKRSFLHFHMMLNDTDVLDNIDEKELKNSITSMLKDWDSALYEVLRDRLGQECDEVFAGFESYFSEAYKSKNTPEDAFLDIVRIRRQDENSSLLHFSGGKAVLRIYSKSRLLLTELMPIIDNLGLNVYEQDIFEPTADGHGLYVNVVYLTNIDDPGGFTETYKVILPELITAVIAGRAENDRLNSLCVTRKLTWRQTDILRTFVYFAKQIESSFLIKSLMSALINNAEIAEKLVNFFELKFDPDNKKTSTAEIEQDILSLIEGVISVSEDKALRYFMRIVQGTVRTNYFMQPMRDYISIKVKSREMPIIAEPRPMFEVYVHSAEMEGVHLRGGKVARGGIRFSDRNDDFRTEILGLVKTQMVKNSVIVPVGSKGGFIVKKRFKDREQDRANTIKQYSTLIKGLLDITDNYKGNKIVHPSRVRMYDESDPYLVVAADKGTATFSDIANGISVSYGFWLGDAFASGGSVGYDHKKVGITAKGAWENVKRHFRELGKDIQKEEFTAIGIGDMAGDVFGNGMLLSTKIRLLAAFNHMHIFLDPAPDAEKSYAERQRLFKNPSLTWRDYNTELISKGGGVFDRTAKRIELSPEVRMMLGCSETVVTGAELIRLILKAETELLWNGGIGTYFKASGETDRDVGDSTNDDVRVNAGELRAKVAGEGGNLGFTQAARIEFAENGGHIYTDALDNSGGVDMSDHEVNLKIIFNYLVETKTIKDMKERNAYIKKLTSSVTDLVLATNYSQSMAVSCDLIRYASNPVTFREAAKHLKSEGLLDFRIEKLAFPSKDKNATAPELAVLLAYMKIYLYNNVENTLNLDNPLVRKEYLNYYPGDMVEKFGDKLFSHKLFRQIAATVTVNRALNQTGISFFYELMKGTNRPLNEILECYLLAEEIVGCRRLRDEICALDGKADAETQYRALIELDKTLKVAVEWLIDQRNMNLYKKKGDVLGEILPLVTKYMTSGMKEKYNAMIEEFKNGGLPGSLATAVCVVRYSKPAFDVFRITAETGADVKDVLRRYYEIGGRFGINMLTLKMKHIRIRDEWERINRDGLLLKLKKIQMNLAFAYSAGNKGWFKNLLDTEKHFVENYDKFMDSAAKDEIDSLVPFNVMIESFANVAEKYGAGG